MILIMLRDYAGLSKGKSLTSDVENVKPGQGPYAKFILVTATTMLPQAMPRCRVFSC